jgi:hypothetical protein
MKILTLTTLALLVTTQATLVADAQSRRWKVFLPADKTFRVFVPKATVGMEPPDDKSFRLHTPRASR